MTPHLATLKTCENGKRLEIQDGSDGRLTLTNYKDGAVLYTHDLETGRSVVLELTPAMMAAMAAHLSAGVLKTLKVA